MNFKQMLIIFLLLLGRLSLQAYDTPFLKAISEGDISTVKYFIVKGEDVNKITGYSPLHVAAHEARAEIVKLLVEAGADVNLEIKNVGRPLHFCTIGLGNGYAGERKEEFLWIIQYLIDCGADVNAQLPIRNVAGEITYYQVPLICALTYPVYTSTNCHGGMPDTSYAELLIENGADINLVIQTGFYKESVEKFTALMKEKYSTHLNIESKFGIYDLNTLESESSSTYCINDKGQIVGSYLFQNQKFFFIKNSNGEMSLIDLPPTAEPIKLSNRGFIAGNYFSEKIMKGFFWSSETGLIDIGSLGGVATVVCDMNERGQIVGQSETLRESIIDNSLEKHAYIWEKGAMQDLGTLTGDLGLPGNESIAYSIHNSGTIVGSSNIARCSKGRIIRGNTQAIIKTNSDSDWQIVSNKTNEYMAAYAINDKNEIILKKMLPTGQIKIVILNLNSKKETTLLDSHRIDSAKIMKNGLIALKTSNSIWLFTPQAEAGAICYTPISPTSQLSRNPFWAKINVLQDVNIWGNFVGQGMNLYGENQAIILQPQGDN